MRESTAVLTSRFLTQMETDLLGVLRVTSRRLVRSEGDEDREAIAAWHYRVVRELVRTRRAQSIGVRWIDGE